jgi:hypothetical protein
MLSKRKLVRRRNPKVYMRELCGRVFNINGERIAIGSQHTGRIWTVRNSAEADV